MEVIEHLDEPRLAAFERVLFEFARPRTVVVTTPNVEYNVRFETLPAGKFRQRTTASSGRGGSFRHGRRRGRAVRLRGAIPARRAGGRRGRAGDADGGVPDRVTGTPMQLMVFCRAAGQREVHVLCEAVRRHAPATQHGHAQDPSSRRSLLFAACLAAKQPTVIDNTNPTIEERARYIAPAKAQGFGVIGYYFQSRLEDCKRRNASRPEDRVGAAVGLLGTYKRLVRPTLAEGFDRLYYVRIDAGEFVVQEWSDDIR